MKIIDLDDLTSVSSALAALPPLPIGALVVAAHNLLDEASDLPQPRYITISETQAISLQFAPVPTTLRDISRWALRFGGQMITQPVRDRLIHRELRCALKFDYYGVDVDAYAYIPAGTATT